MLPTAHMSCQIYFNPRPPAKGATDREASAHYFVDISIHAPREGGDGGI